MSSSLFEPLEARTLLHGGAGFDLHVNFQPGSASVPAGYFPDAGLVYGNRGNGFTYGWDAANSTGARERNKLADQRYDTFNHTQAYGTRTWEAAVPNGQYTVRLVAGDPSYVNSIYKFNVEGVLTVNGTPTTSSRFVEGTQTVTVSDGRLTISNAPGAGNNKLAFVEIQSVDSAVQTVAVSATASSAGEGGLGGTFTFIRGGSTAEALDIFYSLTGTATNGSDYVQLLTKVTIPAGQSTALLVVSPIDDPTPEPSESVILSLLADPTYQIGGDNSATVTISDNDATGDFSAKINFQPASAPIPAGYLPDAGQSYGPRNGLTYGWSADNASWSRDRNKAASPDQRYDTLNHFSGKSWDLAVPNGTYSVRIVAGDPSYFDSVYKINAEGVLVVNGTPTTGNRWLEGSALVNVTDSKLTLTNASGAVNNKINFIEVVASDTQLPILTVSAPTTNASENGPTARSFTLTRTGSTSASLQAYFTIGGSATNSVDYDAVTSPVTFPAGSSTATVTINPVNDPSVESTETVTLTLVSQSGYIVGGASASTIRINDNDTPVGNTITWSTKAANPLGRAEALRATVDGKLYVFGGFQGDGPSKRADVYDPVLNTWTRIADMPTRLSHAGVAVEGRDIYVAGGYVGTGTSGWGQKFGVKDVWKYNVDANQWNAFTALPKEVAGGGMVLLGRELHWVSGNNNLRQDIGDHYVLDLDNTAAGWKTATALPTGRSHLGVVTLGGKIYAVAGQIGNDEALTTKKLVHVWDPVNPSVWTQLADLPTAISHIASATFVMGNRIVVAGGETAHNQPTDLVYAYDAATGVWSAMTKLPAKRFSGVAVEIDGEIYFTTGSSQTTTWKGIVT